MFFALFATLGRPRRFFSRWFIY